MIERGKSADQLEKGKVNKRLAEAIAQDKGISRGRREQFSLNVDIAFALEGYVQP